MEIKDLKSDIPDLSTVQQKIESWPERCAIRPDQLQFLSPVKEFVNNLQSNFLDPLAELRQQILGDAYKVIQETRKSIQEVTTYVESLPATVTSQVEKAIQDKLDELAEKASQDPSAQKILRTIGNIRQIIDLIRHAQEIAQTLLSSVTACLEEVRGDFKDWWYTPVKTEEKK